jgi:FlaA1/EpsC-like NDP-sugar epimerase
MIKNSTVEKENNDLLLNRLTAIVASISRRTKQFIVLGIDTFCILFTVWLSFSFRYETFHRPEGNEWLAYASSVLIALPIFIRSGFYRSIFRYSGFGAIRTLVKACFQYGLLYFIVVMVFLPSGIPHSIGILQPVLLLLSVGSSRAMVRYMINPANNQLSSRCIKEKILIYGAGSAGIQIASSLQYNAKYSVEGFIDDDSALYGKCINGLTVCRTEDVPLLVKSKGISTILIALPRITRSRRREIYHSLEALSVYIRTLPGIEDIANGKITISDIREFDIEDLLGRDMVSPERALFAKCIKGKTVLVTGSGGSIGSELCRQILLLEPETLLLIEHSEYSLYILHRELEERVHTHGLLVKIIPILGDVTDRRYMLELCTRYRPHTIYHAAAYKHVPMVEENAAEGLRNNVFGTLSIAIAAQQSGVNHFILVSTDKAVRPTNIMGASKRIAELVLQAMASEQREDSTCFSMVRFGNVLGSSGSVVPLFRQQINNGGPITVTHKEVTRYFMTISEAAQLVIQAGAMAFGGDVFLLDMGEPVKIIDLARRMVELSGLTVKDQDNPDGDIEIVVTGLREGEKLYEELLIADNPINTAHKRIFKAHENYIKYDQLEQYLHTLENMISDGNCDMNGLKELIKTIVKGYHCNGFSSDIKEVRLLPKQTLDI